MEDDLYNIQMTMLINVLIDFYSKDYDLKHLKDILNMYIILILVLVVFNILKNYIKIKKS